MPTQSPASNPHEDVVDAPERDQPPSTSSSPIESEKVEEIGGPSGPEPTRYGDWERKGRCIDF